MHQFELKHYRIPLLVTRVLMTARTAEDETVQMTARTAAEPIESMIKGLVADFQQIARDWHGE